METFNIEKKNRINSYQDNNLLSNSANKFFENSVDAQYCYNFSWLGFPIIQYPQDIIALQEIIFETKPNFIIETGFARGGSAVFYASILEMIHDVSKVISIDIDVNKSALDDIHKTKFSNKIEVMEGSSVSEEIHAELRKKIKAEDKIMVVLDSMHTHKHVFEELKLFSKYVSKGCYLCVMDTAISYLSDQTSINRPWSRENSPLTAVKEYLTVSKDFKVDFEIDNKLQISVAKNGYLKKL